MAARWSLKEAMRVFKLPMADLMYEAQSVHRANFNPNEMQISTLLSIKTGACPENCSYCPQSAYYKTEIKKEPLMQIAQVVAAAKAAKESGSTRFCMGAAWRGPTDRNLPLVCDMVKEVKKLGLETCVTLGLLKERHAEQLKEAGLDFYNHNIDTSPEYYKKIISTRTFEDRIRTLENVRNAGIKVCCGGILGMGETNEDRIKMLLVLANLAEPPESVPINQLIRIPGTPLADAAPVQGTDFVRTVALTRIMIPKCYIRLSAGREHMSEEMQTLCFLAGVNSVFYGEKLLTANNQRPDRDDELLSKLGFEKMKIHEADADGECRKENVN